MNHEQLHSIIEARGFCRHGRTNAGVVNADAPRVSYNTIAVSQGPVSSAALRVMVEQQLAATTDAGEQAVIAMFRDTLRAGGVSVGDAQVRVDMQSMAESLPTDEAAALAGLFEARVKPIFGETVTALDVQKAKLIGASNAAVRLAVASDERKAEDAVAVIKAWDGTGDPRAIYGA